MMSLQVNNNILDYILQQTGARPKRQGDKVLLPDCPVCKHKNHFYIYPKTNSYYSFSGCCKGGSLVDWMMEYEGLTLAVAMSRVHGDINPFDEKEHNQFAQIRSGLRNWRNKAHDRLCVMFRATQTAKKTLQPDTAGYFAACEFEGILD